MNVTIRGRAKHFRTVAFDRARNAVLLIEQRLLPHEFKIVATRNFRETAAAIRDMVVRGAPAIAATAAYGLAQGALAFRGSDLQKFSARVEAVYQTLRAARPTAVDPVNAMNGVRSVMRAGKTVAEKQSLALAAAEEFASGSVRDCEAIGRHGARLIRDGMRILTHCNAGWLACVDIGTATAPMYAAQARGKEFHVFCDETRPRSQGATLTAWELAQQKIPHQIIADNAAGHLMQRGEIDLVIVGSDRVLGRTGDAANKIGTYTKAVLAARHKIPFYAAIPLSTIDWNLERGFDIPIEERCADEVLGAWGVLPMNPVGPTCWSVRTRGSASLPWFKGSMRENVRRNLADGHHLKNRRAFIQVANPTSGARNPGFDVTPAELVTGIITPAGIFKPAELWSRRRELGFS